MFFASVNSWIDSYFGAAERALHVKWAKSMAHVHWTAIAEWNKSSIAADANESSKWHKRHEAIKALDTKVDAAYA